MEFILIALLLIFLVYIFLDAKHRAAYLRQLINEEKKAIAETSNMTASIGVFYPDRQSTVILGASEEMGALYYRMLRGSKLINRTKINLANVIRVEMMINAQLYPLHLDSPQPTSTLKSSDIASRALNAFSPEALHAIHKTALRIIFLSETGAEKSLEITSLRTNDDRYRFKRTQMLKNSIWWTAFLNLASRHSRHQRKKLEDTATEG